MISKYLPCVFFAVDADLTGRKNDGAARCYLSLGSRNAGAADEETSSHHHYVSYHLPSTGGHIINTIKVRTSQRTEKL
jgi:hypothetical protein